MSDPRTITAWVCDECGYWRQDKTSGVHMAAKPGDPYSRMIPHELRQAFFVEIEAASSGSHARLTRGTE